MIDSQQEQSHINNAQPQREQDIYQRIKLLGTGSFGKAFLVKQIKTDQLYVIKQINMVDLDSNEQQNARRQAKILQVLDHPNIVRFKQTYATAKMKLNIVMEYCAGGDLAARIKQAKSKTKYFQQADILNWFTQICLGIKHIHDRKIIHRDLKGQNIFLNQSDCVKIGDFGVAKVLQHTIAKAKTVVGSPYYLSPQIIQNRPYSAKTDIWSLGALLFEMCALQPPFTANNLQFLALKIVKGSYSQIPSQYSADLKTLIKSMLNTNPNGRPNINQILSSPLLNRRIKCLLTQSQNIKQFSHTVLHKYNPLKNQIQDKLRPPPNLMQIEQDNENQSAVLTNQAKKYFDQQQQQGQTKAKTPYCYGKNAPPIKKKVPLSSQKRMKANTVQDLNQIMKIKSTPLQQHLQPPKIPKATPNFIKKRPETPKTNVNNNLNVEGLNNRIIKININSIENCLQNKSDKLIENISNNINKQVTQANISNQNSNNIQINGNNIVNVKKEVEKSKPKTITPVVYSKKKSIDCAQYKKQKSKQVQRYSSKPKQKENDKQEKQKRTKRRDSQQEQEKKRMNKYVCDQQNNNREVKQEELEEMETDKQSRLKITQNQYSQIEQQKSIKTTNNASQPMNQYNYQQNQIPETQIQQNYSQQLQQYKTNQELIQNHSLPAHTPTQNKSQNYVGNVYNNSDNNLRNVNTKVNAPKSRNSGQYENQNKVIKTSQIRRKNNSRQSSNKQLKHQQNNKHFPTNLNANNLNKNSNVNGGGKIMKKTDIKTNINKLLNKQKQKETNNLFTNGRQKQKAEQNLELVSQQMKNKYKIEQERERQRQKKANKKPVQIKRTKTANTHTSTGTNSTATNNNANVNKRTSNKRATNSNSNSRNSQRKQKQRVNQQCQTQTQNFFNQENRLKQEQIVEQQKCNDISVSDDKYYEDQFDVYDQNGDKQEQLQNMSFQLSNSSINDEISKINKKQSNIQQNQSQNNNYQKMMAQLEMINKMVEQANGKVDNLPMLGQQIPQLLELSDQIRQDDSDLESQISRINFKNNNNKLIDFNVSLNSNTNTYRDTNHKLQVGQSYKSKNIENITKTLQNISSQSGVINLACLSDQSQLQNLRIALQQIFGIEHLLTIYKFMSEVIAKKQLDFNQEEVIRSLLKLEDLQIGAKIDQCLLRRHFRLIVTVIALQNQLMTDKRIQ